MSLNDNSNKWQFWIDRGGTFTDVVAQKPDKTLITGKFLSENPEQYKDAAIFGIRSLLGLQSDEEIPHHKISFIKMGTTVATNALLERQGEKTLLVITKGFKDALRIGYQNRPELFARHIKLPEMLYKHVIEIEERIDSKGSIINPIDLKSSEKEMQLAYQNGFRSVAIVLLHGYKFTSHEEQLRDIASKIGFTQISTSNQISPLVKLIARGDTTVVDAYLSPLLKKYVNQVSNQLGGDGKTPRLMFMQSNGGLTAAEFFRGRDAVLSGPAGGVVGMVQTAAKSGFHKLIGFDMGGTSTDVTHYDNEYERSFETSVAGVRMRAPMMNIHTVAAGGGSVLIFDGSRYRVGPQSAGANPGPTGYRRGGPLTVTDCNILLGRIQPEYFPKVFGKNANEPLDVETVRSNFEKLAKIISDKTKQPLETPEKVAEGFLRIAVENMANAIKKISVQRGYDVTEYTMQCFGGAGGQFACWVADLIGMTKIFLHPLSGVLSAYGMGLADIRVMREIQIEILIKDSNLMQLLKSKSESLINSAVEEVSLQGIYRENISTNSKVQIRYFGTDTSLSVNLNNPEIMKKEFEKIHKQRFGFNPENRDLIIESIFVEAIGATETVPDTIYKLSNSVPQEFTKVMVWRNGSRQATNLFKRELLLPGQIVKGPAIISESTGTILVEEGWLANINQFNHLVLERYEKREIKEAIGTKVDPVMLEVFKNLFMAIAEQMGVTLANTACSVNIKERLDFSCAIFDGLGNLVANAPHVPVHLGSMGESVKAIIQKYKNNIMPGDVFMLNAPYNGGTHLPDVTVITPCFDEKNNEILFYLGARGHHADIGGRTPGSSPPDSKHIEEEGVVIDGFRLVSKGHLLEKETRNLLSSGKYPCRNIDQNLADLSAQIASNETGVRELLNMVKHFGLESVKAYMQHVQDNAEESVRRVLEVLKPGEFKYLMDNGSAICVKISIDKQKREAIIDFTGTSKQNLGNYNAPKSICRAAVLYVFRTLVDDDIPLNEGCMKPLKLVIPEGSMINPVYPAAVISGNTEVSQAITDALYGALGILASSQGTMNNFLYGNEKIQNYETICGGTGAGINHPGTSAVHSHMTNTRMTDPEILEMRFPVLVDEFSIRSNSGGRGKYSGGDGVVRRLKFLEPMTATILSSHRVTEPYGLENGLPGAKGINSLIRKDGKREVLSGNVEVQLHPGDLIQIETPGGGGFGKSE